MLLNEYPYPLQLVLCMLHYSIVHSPQCAGVKYDKIKEQLAFFFPTDLIDEASKILAGASVPPENEKTNVQN